jgi:hypothetical protein
MSTCKPYRRSKSLIPFSLGGKLKSLTLSHANIDCFLVEIPVAALTQTFRDAIEVAQALGFDYIWIDTLCIIQDTDSDDWSIESARMSDVYGNPHLNIAATSASDGSHGLLEVGKEHRNKSFRAWAYSEDGKRQKAYHFVPFNFYRNSMSEAPLLQRAWVFQERLLAKRTAHFTSTQIFWECSHTTACEAFPVKLPSIYSTSWMEPGPVFHKQSLQNYKWEDIVRLYTTCRLTFSRDKLPAIYGVAHQMTRLKHCEYMVGFLLNETFPLQLCWHSDKAASLPRPTTYRAPSWSWASVDSAISYKDANISWLDLDDLSILVELVPGQSPPVRPTAAIDSSTSSQMRFNCKMLLHAACAGDPLFDKVWVIDGVKVTARCTFDCAEENHMDLYLLFVSRPTAIASYYKETDCLILQKTSIKNGQYVRVMIMYFMFHFVRIMGHTISCFGGIEILLTTNYPDIGE